LVEGVQFGVCSFEFFLDDDRHLAFFLKRVFFANGFHQYRLTQIVDG
jgi:hypothetical protein